MKVLINGSSGFIGANLIKHFSKMQEGADVEIWALSKRKIDSVIKEYFHLGELKYLEEITDLPNNYFDVIFNSSGPSQPSIFISNPKLVFESNVFEVPTLLNALKRDGRFFQFSSSEIYSGCLDLPCLESHRGSIESTNPRISYVLAKEISERILEAYKSPNQKICILRLSLVFGPGVLWDDTRFLSEMIKKGIRGDIEVTANANVRRYLYIDDFIFVIDKLMNYDSPFCVFNVGGFQDLSLVDIARMVGNKLNKDVIIKEDTNSSGAPINVSVSMKKFLGEVSDFQFTDFDIGLDKTIAWFKIIESKLKS
jgi:nucleoside-diphosphate-sugar epimerase